MPALKVLVACEFSGVVRDAFRRHGHDAVSCDLLPTEVPGPHYQGDVFEFLAQYPGRFDLMVAFPPCTYLSVSGNRWMRCPSRSAQIVEAVDFVKRLWALPIFYVALENPVSRLSSLFSPPTQSVQPWQFGHGEVKRTCFWLRNLPLLVPTNVVPGRDDRVHRAVPGPDRWRERSRFLPGLADAMAFQWGRSILDGPGLLW